MKFPTIKQLMQAIGFWSQGINIRYDEIRHTFSYTEMIPYKCYDSGGALDSIGFEEQENTLTFLQAYQCWQDLEKFYNENCPTPVPVYTGDEETELPF